jgi:hypothetical protein
MRGKKFFLIGIALTACILVLLLAGEAGLVAWAKPPPKMTQYYGYVILRDDTNDKIWSDGGGQYADYHISGWEDYVTLEIENKSGDLIRSDFKCGWPPSSTRKVLMDLANATQIAPPDSTEEIFLNILLLQELSNPDNPIAHLQAGVSIGRTVQLEYVDFIADTITRKVLWAEPYNIPDEELQKYRFSSYTGLEYEDQHLSYGLRYEGCTVTEETGTENPTWTIVPYGSPVELFVYKQQSGGKKGKGKPGGYEPSVLATYVEMPFGYTTWYVPPQSAPRKDNTISTIWGGIKRLSDSPFGSS